VGYLEHHPEILVTQLNLSDILRVLDLQEVVTFEEASNMLAYYRNSEARFEEYAVDLVACIERNTEDDSLMEESAEIKVVRFLERLREAGVTVEGMEPK